MHVKNKRKTTSKTATTNLRKHMHSKIEGIEVKRIHPSVVIFMISVVLQDNSATVSPPGYLNWTVYPPLHVTIRILFLCRTSDSDFTRLQSISYDILKEIFSCETWITCFSRCCAAFEKLFHDWTMTLLFYLLLTFAWTKILTLPPISSIIPLTHYL